MKNGDFNNGTVRISNDILTLISAMATVEIEGVYSLLGMENIDISKVNTNQIKGVLLDVEEDSILIDIDIIVEEDRKVNRVAMAVQKNVIDKIKLMTGLDVNCVNIQITGLHS